MVRTSIGVFRRLQESGAQKLSDASQPATIGVDLGGTRYKIGWLTGDEPLRDVQSYPTGGHRPVGTVLSEVAAAIATTRAQAAAAGTTVAAIGIGVPAVIDPTRGVIEMLPNFSASWQHFAMADALSALVGLPARLINDARAYTLAEARIGAAKGIANVLGVTLGTGVGGGLVLDARLRFGPHHLAGEFGHLTVDPHGPRCGCGSRGCIESYASAPAIAAMALRPLLQGRTPILRELVKDAPGNLSADLVAQAAAAGEVECIEIFARVGEILGVGIAHVMKLVDIDCAVIGGGVAAAGEVLLAPLREQLRASTIVFGGYQPKIVTASVPQPGATGAALWAQDHIQQGGLP